jgi:hypothetical protein
VTRSPETPAPVSRRRNSPNRREWSTRSDISRRGFKTPPSPRLPSATLPYRFAPKEVHWRWRPIDGRTRSPDSAVDRSRLRNQ